MPWSGPRIIVSAAGASTSIRVHFLDLGGRSWPTDQPPTRPLRNVKHSRISGLLYYNGMRGNGVKWTVGAG